MTPTIWDSIADTPWWILATYLYLLRFGYLSTKSRIVHLNVISRTTFIFFTTTLILFALTKQFTLPKIALWLASLSVGMLIGWLQYRLMRIKAIKDERLIRLPGSWFLLLTTPLLIYFQLQKGYNYIASLDLMHNPTLLFWLPVAYGLMAGVIIGKLIYARRCVKKGPFLLTSSH